MQINPDIKFIKELQQKSKAPLKQCMQCGNCTVVCELSPAENPFPRKEMIWAGWGLKDKLLSDPDIWLCHQCGDCSTYCPRGVKPGDVLSVLRQESIIHFSRPKFFGKVMSKAWFLPFAFLIPLLLILLLLFSQGELKFPEGPVNYGKFFPHALLNSVFSVLFLLTCISMGLSLGSFWKTLKNSQKDFKATKSFFKALLETKIEIFTHKKFKQCTAHKYRYYAHFLTLWGFVLLLFVTFFAILAVIFFAYPLPFWNPIKIAGNIGFLMLFAGLSLMIYERLFNKKQAGNSSYFDWVFLWSFYLLIISGIVVELARFANWEGGYFCYVAHLVLVWFIIIFIPYTKFAHMLYRTLAITFLKISGRK
jgi:quinone-modifying oxidoreductase, subunit QmoC